MNHVLSTPRHVLLCAAVVMSACLPSVVHAGQVTYDAFLEGSGITVYSATGPTTGSGAWTGTLADSPFPVPLMPLSLLTQVFFSFDALNNALNGDFEFTSATDFNSTIDGLLSGSFLSGDFDNGGQLFLNYDIRGGTGDFFSANGYLISLMDVVSSGGGFGTYGEVASGQFMVPEPTTLALVLASLTLLVGRAATSRPRDARLGT